MDFLMKKEFDLQCLDCPPLPSCWNYYDRDSFCDIKNQGLTVFYRGNGQSDEEASSIRSDFQIPYYCSIYYYEVEIINSGEYGYIGIGLSQEQSNLKNLPGWENSIGFHGDDGDLYYCSGEGYSYHQDGYTEGDVIGVCYNLMKQTIFFVKNGEKLKEIRNIKYHKCSYPTVGFRSKGEVIHANFGQKKFRYDLQSYIDEQKRQIQEQIAKKYISDKSLLFSLVLSHLICQGNEKTLKILLKESEFFSTTTTTTKMTKESELISKKNPNYPFTSLSKEKMDYIFKRMKQRKKIKNNILEGNIECAKIKILKYCKDFQKKDKALWYELKKQEFIELIRNGKGSIDQQILQFGRELFQYSENELNNTDRDLWDVLSLVLYPNTSSSSSSSPSSSSSSPLTNHLFENQRREKLSNLIQQSLLTIDQLSSTSPINKMISYFANLKNQSIKSNKVGFIGLLNIKKIIGIK
ncbi:ran-binding protein 9/10 [Anaeramoeba flamelloides]|uniref:Ran-binding protein 9/10 n=1 Tax=Anaeramoeba flamelloides TaxID=1746091 RepID=A0ABQ8YUA5_9EUKA|nr:ran-binding protein 9/10 [Anaeramoeba flamelloides]